MASCKECVHVEVCETFSLLSEAFEIASPERIASDCEHFANRSRFVELNIAKNIAKKIKHTPDIEKMREFHKLGLGKGMGERSIFWTCSNCELWVSLAHNFCPNCGAKFEAEQALKERE